jgi:hypothetical protein
MTEEFIRVWYSNGEHAHTWAHVRASAIVSVHEERGHLQSDSRRITLVIGREAIWGSAEVSELTKAGLPVPDASPVARRHRHPLV